MLIICFLLIKRMVITRVNTITTKYDKYNKSMIMKRICLPKIVTKARDSNKLQQRYFLFSFSNPCLPLGSLLPISLQWPAMHELLNVSAKHKDSLLGFYHSFCRSSSNNSLELS